MASDDDPRVARVGVFGGLALRVLGRDAAFFAVFLARFTAGAFDTFLAAFLTVRLVVCTRFLVVRLVVAMVERGTPTARMQTAFEGSTRFPYARLRRGC